MATKAHSLSIENIEPLIYLVRGHRVMLDFDLAAIYGVTTKRLNEQFKRNRGRFPADFEFKLEHEELKNLKSQIATSRSHGGRRHVPVAFTEHGAIMLAAILNSSTAIAASVRVVRAFVFMREQLAAHRELSSKLAELEQRLDGHDESIQQLFGAIRRLIEAPAPDGSRREIGFHVKNRRTGSQVYGRLSPAIRP